MFFDFRLRFSLFLSIWITSYLFAGPFAPQKDSAHLVLRLKDQDSSQISLQGGMYNQYEKNEGEYSYYQNSIAAYILLKGSVRKNFRFQSTVDVFTDISDRIYPLHDYQPYNGMPYNIQADTLLTDGAERRTWDFFTSHIWWEHPFITLETGIDFLEFGPARRNKLAWSGNEQIYRPLEQQETSIEQKAPLTFWGWDSHFSWIRYQQYGGFLAHDKNKSKHFHTHRLEFDLPASIILGLSETIVYGSSVEADTLDRERNFVYDLPFVPYYFAEHYGGDRDNKAMGMDVSWKFFPNWEAYSELFLDDMRLPGGFMDDSWWGNKWALSSGIAWEAELWGHHWQWYSEYTHIEPWVYTHMRGASHRYSHYGHSLGASLGPNSQELYTEFRWQTPKKLVGIELAFASVDKDTARGGNLEDIHRDSDRIDQCYLCAGSTIHYSEMSGALLFDWWIFDAKAGMVLYDHPDLDKRYFANVRFIY
jgi:hypothetical protein